MKFYNFLYLLTTNQPEIFFLHFLPVETFLNFKGLAKSLLFLIPSVQIFQYLSPGNTTLLTNSSIT